MRRTSTFLFLVLSHCISPRHIPCNSWSAHVTSSRCEPHQITSWRLHKWSWMFNVSCDARSCHDIQLVSSLQNCGLNLGQLGHTLRSMLQNLNLNNSLESPVPSGRRELFVPGADYYSRAWSRWPHLVLFPLLHPRLSSWNRADVHILYILYILSNRLHRNNPGAQGFSSPKANHPSIAPSRLPSSRLSSLPRTRPFPIWILLLRLLSWVGWPLGWPLSYHLSSLPSYSSLRWLLSSLPWLGWPHSDKPINGCSQVGTRFAKNALNISIMHCSSMSHMQFAVCYVHACAFCDGCGSWGCTLICTNLGRQGVHPSEHAIHKLAGQVKTAV